MSKILNNGIFSETTIKIIAMISMLIDHIALCIPYIWMHQDTYRIMRNIGRIAFPIFCFCIIEGYYHTSDVKKYMFRLFIFALISEIPFDLAVNSGGIFGINHQNVFFTLCIGLCMIYIVDNASSGIIMRLFAIGAACLTARVLRTDYSMFGIIQILTFYVLRNNRIGRIICITALNTIYGQPAGALSLLFTECYNGKRGFNVKYLMYAFYPVQFMILYLIRSKY